MHPSHKSALHVASVFLGLFLISAIIIPSPAPVAASLTTQYLATSVIGQQDFQDITSGTSATTLNLPKGVALDTTNHRLYVADQSNNRVLMYPLASNNTIASGTAATIVLGQTLFTTNGSGDLSYPLAVAVDPALNYLYVADSLNNRILIYDTTSLTSGQAPSHVLGQSSLDPGQVDCNRSGPSAAPTAATLCAPNGLAVDTSTHYLFVRDRGRALAYNMSGTITDGMDASYVIGNYNFTTTSANGSPCSTPTYQNTVCDSGFGMAVDPIHHILYVDDTYTNIRILAFDLLKLQNAMPALAVLGQSDFTLRSTGVSRSKIGIGASFAVDPASHLLYAADYSNARILAFDTTDIDNRTRTSLSEFNANAPAQSLNSYYQSIAGNSSDSVTSVGDFALDSDNHLLFVSEFGRILVYHLNDDNSLATSTFSYVIGQSDFISTTAATTRGGLNNSNGGIALDAVHHNLYVTDDNNNRVLVFPLNTDNTPTSVTSELASNVIGQSNFTSNASGESSTLLHGPLGIDIDPVSQLLYVGDSNSRVLVFDAANLLTTSTVAIHVLGCTSFSSGCGGTASSSNMNIPSHIVVDHTAGRVYVSDQNDNRVTVFDISGGVSNNMPASYVLGQISFASTTLLSPSQTSLALPQGLALDTINHKLYVANDHRISIFDTTSLLATNTPAIGVIGQRDYTSTTTDDRYWKGIEVDPTNGILYGAVIKDGNGLYGRLSSITTTGDMIYLKHSPADGENAAFVLGQTNFTSHNTGASQGELAQPSGLAFDATNGVLYAVDTFANRVTEYILPTLTAGTWPSGVVGTAYSKSFTPINTSSSTAVSLLSGSLPPGLSISGTSVTGTPTTVGTYSFSLQALYDNGTAGNPFTVSDATITIAAAPVVNSPGGGGGNYGGGGGCSGCTGNNLLPYIPNTPNASSTARVIQGGQPLNPLAPQLPPNPTAYYFTKNLSLGSKDAQVKLLQQYLNTHGYPVAVSGAGSRGKESTVFAARTKAALIKFQKAKGIKPASGLFGPLTRKYISTH